MIRKISEHRIKYFKQSVRIGGKKVILLSFDYYAMLQMIVDYSDKLSACRAQNELAKWGR